MKLKHLMLMLAMIAGFGTARAQNTTVVPSTWTQVQFNPDVRYSQWAIESQLGNFYSNATKRPFQLFDADGKAVAGTAYDKNTKFDYVPGLVAKATIEARDLYQNFDWSKPWFYTVMNYGQNYTYTEKVNGLADSKLTLDDMNAAKMYFGIAKDRLATAANKTLVSEQVGKVIEIMKRYNDTWAIGGSKSTNAIGDIVAGGWFHKPEYIDQMWGDGLYMGSALLAQIINYTGTSANVTDNDWDLITKQFTISWEQMYNENNGLLYHAFTANPESAKAAGWAGVEAGKTYHSAAHWGRACGWYFLALVDVLEQMQDANMETTDNYKTLKGYLELLAAGLAKYQDEATGCWYQVLDEKDAPLSGNYLESSCTAIFSAAYLKGARIGVLDKTTYEPVGEKAYEGCVNNFMMKDDNGNAQLIHCCASAGLGGSDKRSGSREYYITGSDVTQRNTYTEGKVLGGFILAATEYERLHEKVNAPMLSVDLNSSYTVANGETATLEVKVSGTDSPVYQWCKGTWDTFTRIDVATSSTYSPKESGKYFCEVTTGAAAKGMAARAATTIRSSVADVTVAGTADSGDDEPTNGLVSHTVWYGADVDKPEGVIEGNFGISSKSDLKDFSDTYTIDGIKYTMTKATQQNPTINFTIPEGEKGSFYLALSSSAAGTRNLTLKSGSVDVDNSKSVTGTNAQHIEYKSLGSGTYTLTFSGNVKIGFLCLSLQNASSSDLKPSDLANQQYRGTWTPAVGGTVSLSDLVTSSSTGAYSISAGTDIATLENGVLTAKKSGTVTISQAATSEYAAGTVDINIAIGNNIASDGTNSFYFSGETVVSDGMTISRKDMTMQFGNDGFWSKPGNTNGYTAGQKNPTANNNIPTSGTFYKFTPTKNGSLVVKINLGANKALFISENGTLIDATAGNVTVGAGSAYSTSDAYIGNVKFSVKANTDYYVYAKGSKMAFYGFEFTPEEIQDENLPIATFTVITGTTIGTEWLSEEKNGVQITSKSSIKDDSKRDNVKFSNGNSLSLEVPAGVTVTSVKFNAKNVSNSGKESDGTVVSIGSVSQTFDANNTYTVKTYEFSQGITGPATLTISNSNKEVNIQGIEVYGVDTTTESNSHATFSYNGLPLSFTSAVENEEAVWATTIEVETSQKNTELQISVAKAAGATIVDGNGHELSGSTISISVGTEPGDYYYTVTSADKSSTTKYKISIKFQKQAIVLKYTPAKWEWDKEKGEVSIDDATPVKYTTFTQPVLKAYIADAAGKATKEEVSLEKLTIKFESDLKQIATVADDGTISLVESASGGAKIYATFAGNDDYEAAETFFNVIIGNGYSYEVKKDQTAPALNSFAYIYGKDNEMLVRMKFGGWKRNGGKYTPAANEITDSWSKGETNADIASIDDYVYGHSGTNDAMDEAMKLSDEPIRGSYRRGWFTSPEYDDKGNVVKTFPFTLPVRGTFMTFEPQMNGTMSIYIIQNGCWNTDSKSNIIPGQFRTHAFQVVNQRGLPLRDFSPAYSVTTKQSVTKEYYCDLNEEDTEGLGANSKNVAHWPEFNDYLNEDERKDIAVNWKSGIHGSQKIIELSTGSFLAIQKGIVKYTFHVTGHETYYFFSNFSKMGFCGANFVPDGAASQPTETLTLSDTEAFPVISQDAIKDEYYYGNTKFPKYDFKFNGKSCGNVEGVHAPQFKEIVVKRTFKKDQWNTLTLPFNMTQVKVEQVFGKGTEIILLNNSTINGDVVKLQFIYHEIQNILPGYPYFIKPTFEYEEGSCSSKDGVRTFTGAELTEFRVPVKHVNHAILPQIIGDGEYESLGTPGYSTANVVNASGVSGYSMKYPEGDIFLSDGNGGLYISEGQSYGKGYRAYIRKKDNGTPAAKSISMTYSGVEDNFDNTTTEIRFADLTPEAAITVGVRGVYNLNGQKVAETVNNLPAGVYIVNGQKIVVK